MKLIVEDLKGQYLEQKILVGTRPINIVALRPHIYKHLNPAGSLKLQLRDASGTLLKESDAVTIQSITDASGDYFHGYVKFTLEAGLLPETTYRLRLSTTGYSHSESAYIGWCRDFDLQKYDADFTPESGVSSALGVEIWENKNVVKGQL